MKEELEKMMEDGVIEEWMRSTCCLSQKEGWVTKILCGLQELECLDMPKCLPYAKSG